MDSQVLFMTGDRKAYDTVRLTEKLLPGVSLYATRQEEGPGIMIRHQNYQGTIPVDKEATPKELAVMACTAYYHTLLLGSVPEA